MAAAAVLTDDLRRRMYAFIRRADGPVTRDEVAAEIGISRKLAAFHLDKLAAAGLLRNCPFHPLAAGARELVCGINHSFLTGFLDGLGAASAAAVLNPAPGHCCVELRAASPAS